MSERDKRKGGYNSVGNKSNSRRDGRGNDRRQQDERSQYIEHVVTTNRVFKAIKDGRRLSFTALVIVDDGEGMVDVGYGETKEVPAAIQKGIEEARENFFRVLIITSTITRPVQGETVASIVLLRPAAPDTGLIAGGAVRPVLEYTDTQDVLFRSPGTNNSISVVRATVDALKQLVRSREVTARRGKSLGETTLACVPRAHAGQGV